MVRYAMDEYLNANKSAFETVESTREFITNNIGQIEETVSHVLDTINYDSEFEVSYGAHLFPEKQYNGETYEQGYYESLVITIGEGRGNNWWCFMNPDLCLGPSAKASESNESSDWNNQYNAMETTQEAFQEKNLNLILLKSLIISLEIKKQKLTFLQKMLKRKVGIYTRMSINPDLI